MAIRDDAQGRLDLGPRGPLRPRSPERLFFAVMPDAEAAARLYRFGTAFIGPHGLSGRRLEPERLHLSLHHVGDFARLRSKFLFAAERAARAVSARPFDLTFRSIGTFEPPPSRSGRPPARALVLLGSDDRLLDLYRRLGAAMRENGLKPSPHIEPHVTLSYGRERVPFQSIEPIGCGVASFVLVHSERGLGRYNILGRWTLGGESTPISDLAA